MPLIELYMFAISQQVRNAKGGRLDKESAPDVTLRPTRMMTAVEKHGLVSIDGLYIAGTNQLMHPIDAYELSVKLFEKQQAAFLKEHGLEDKTPEQIDAWLERHRMSLPGPFLIDLPTIKKGTAVRITGKFSDVLSEDFLFTLSLSGPAYQARG